MIRSMTGYGRSHYELPARKVVIELKSLNSKQLDLNTRIPSAYRQKEPEIRNQISRRLERGKVDLFITIEMPGNAGTQLNTELVKSYALEIRKLATEIGLESATDCLGIAFRLPDVMKTEQELIDTREWEMLEDSLNEAIDALDQYRRQEGLAIEEDFLFRVNLIESFVKQIEPLDDQRRILRKERLQNALAEIMEIQAVDKNRLEQEMVYYIEKFDFTEEMVRLKQHCLYFRETVTQDAASGRKLGFIAQEIGREINTLGSKANDALIQKIVVQMKDELEKIREQIGNVL